MAAGKIRLGVIGLGRLWEIRHRPALARLQDRFAVTAIYHQVARRAEIEARQLGCRAADGLTELITSPDVDALAYLAPQWFGTYPVELAARAGKPIYCALPLPDTEAELSKLGALGASTRPTLMVGFPHRFYPATIRLRELIQAGRGPLRSLALTVNLLRHDPTRLPDPAIQGSVGSILTDPGQSCVDLCRHLTGAAVVAVHATPTGSPTGFEGESSHSSSLLQLANADQATVALGLAAGSPESALPTQPVPPMLRAMLGNQPVCVHWPDQLQIGDGPETLDETPPAGPPIDEVLFDQFYRMVRGLEHDAPTWEDALAAARTVALLRRSAGSGQRLPATAEREPSAPHPGSAP